MGRRFKPDLGHRCIGTSAPGSRLELWLQRIVVKQFVVAGVGRVVRGHDCHVAGVFIVCVSARPAELPCVIMLRARVCRHGTSARCRTRWCHETKGHTWTPHTSSSRKTNTEKPCSAHSAAHTMPSTTPLRTTVSRSRRPPQVGDRKPTSFA